MFCLFLGKHYTVPHFAPRIYYTTKKMKYQVLFEKKLKKNHFFCLLIKKWVKKSKKLFHFDLFCVRIV